MVKSTRPTSKLLPQIFQTETNKKFLSSTLDQLIEPSSLEKLSAFIGRRYHPTYRTNDVYINEVSDERQNYQLEPSVIYESDGDNVDFVAPYIDVVNEIFAQGGNKQKHDRLWTEDLYSYSPPVDPDKLVNFREYYWLQNGPVSISSLVGNAGSQVTIKVTNQDLSAYKFNHKTTANPDIVVYKGNTYHFEVDAPGYNFYIKTQFGTGTDDKFSSDYVTNNGADKGIVTLKVPSSDSSTTNPTVLFYQCEHHQDMQGRIIIKDLSQEEFDPAENLIGVNKFVDATGLEYSSGMKIVFTSNVISTYTGKTYYIEQVGKSIKLVDVDQVRVYEAFGVDLGEVWDEEGKVGWDTTGFDNTEGVAVNPDYWTINRASSDQNAWSRSNRWFHIDVIRKANEKNNFQQTEISSTLRATRPIIEFVPDLQLFNHGFKHVDVDLIDTITTDALSNVNGKTGYRVDKTNLIAGRKVIFQNDPDNKNKIFTVHFDLLPSGSNVIHLVDDSSVLEENTTVFAKQGVDNIGKTYHYINGAWVVSQQKTKVQQKPVFDVFDDTKTSISNNDAYPSNNFLGTTLFEIATDTTQGTPDTVYGTNVIYKRFGLLTDLQFNERFLTDTFDYIEAGEAITRSIKQYFYKINITHDIDVLENTWKKNKKTFLQYKIENYESLESQSNFKVQAWTNPESLTDLEIKVLVNGILNHDWTKTTTTNGVFVTFAKAKTTDDLITIKTYSASGKPTGKGFWELPPSAVSNPYNENFKNFTLGDVIKHYASGAEHHPDISGNLQGINNSRDISNVFEYSQSICQHSGSLPLASVLIRDEVINLLHAMRFSAREYEKFKNSIITTANQISLDGTQADNLDDILELVNKNKNISFPFTTSDMLAYGSDKKVLSYTVTDPGVKNYPITTQFVLNELSARSVYVYKNDVQLIHDQDYIFTTAEDSTGIVGVRLLTDLAIDDVIKIHEHSSTINSFVPATPAKLGLAPKYKPKKFLDDTYQSEDSTTQGIYVIQGHDGSITVAYNDFRDDLLLEFEKRIYNNIKCDYDIDALDLNDGYFKIQDYTSSEFLKMLSRDFFTWSGTNGIDYSTNSTYDSGNDFTYNYSSSVSSLDQKKLKGFWRGIFKNLYDTDRPHTSPWEMFGFVEQPDWWEGRYGPAPYTSGNSILWNDVKEGFIADGPRKGYHRKYARENILSIIPVTEDGKLASPLNAGIVGSNTSSDLERSYKWQFGDNAPPETAWRRSSSYRFAEQIMKFLAKPGLYAGIYFDTSRISKNIIGQYVYEGTYRVPLSQYKVPTSTTLACGYINVLCDYIKSLGYDISYISNRLNNLDSKLTYKLGGFSNKKNMQIVISSYNPQSTNNSVYLPTENYQIELFKSAPVDSVNYSGVIVEKSANGYKVSGYNNFDRSFNYYSPRINNDAVDVIVGGVTDPYLDWKPNTFYSVNTIIKNDNIFYRVDDNITTRDDFTENNLSRIGNRLPIKGGTRVKRYKSFLQNTSTLAYGTELKNMQEVANFLYGYDQYLKTKGFVFDEFSTELNAPVDWDLSVKEFLFWSGQGWSPGAVISLSPASSKLKFEKEYTIGDDLINGSQFYTVLQQDGFPIQKTNLRTSRINGQFVVSTDPTQDGIYNADIRAIQKEHIIIFDNITSFNDVIYDTSLGVRQDRVKLVGWRTANWNGDLYAPGYIVDRAVVGAWIENRDYKKGDVVEYQNRVYVVLENHNSGSIFDASLYRQKTEAPEKDLLPNFDAKAESFRDFYSLDTENFDTEQQKYAQHLIGFQPRSYFENLGLDELTQYKFYQGMIRDKGTNKPITRFKSPTQTLGSVNYSFFEESAFRVGNYGGLRTTQAYEFQLDDQKHRQLQHIYQFTQQNQSDTQNIINVSYQDFARRPQNTSYPILQNITYDSLNTPEYIFEYPVAGYPQSKNVSTTVFDEQELYSIDTTALNEQSTIWIANTPTGNWDVYRVTNINNFIEFYEARDGIMQFHTAKQHRLSPGDYVLVKNFNNQIDGIHKVTDLPDSTDNAFKFSVPFLETFDSTTQAGTIFKLQSVRINSIDDIDGIRPSTDFEIGDRIYVDNNYLSGSGRWKIYELNKNSSYNVQEILENTETSDNDVNFGSVIDVSGSNGLFMAVGSPGDNSVYFYRRDDINENFLIRTKLYQLYDNSDASDRFGHSVKIIGDGSRAFVGSPYSDSIVKIALSSTTRGFSRTAVITGSVSGATGIVLYNDQTNDILYVKMTSGTFQNSEGLDTGDSSSVVTISSVTGISQVNQGLVHCITQDSYGNFIINHSVASPNLQSDEYFGWSVTASNDGTYLVVGAPGSTSDQLDSGLDIGRVYVYKLTETIYVHQQTITSSISQTSDKFGFSVSLSDDGKTLAIGSPGYDRVGTDDSSSTEAGSVHVYRQDGTGVYTEHEVINHGVDETNSQFGYQVQVSSDASDLVVSSPNETDTVSNQGVVYYYKLNSQEFTADGSTSAYTVDFDLDSSFDIGVFIDNAVFTNYVISGNTITFINDDSSSLVLPPDRGRLIKVYQYKQYQKIVQLNPRINAGFGKSFKLRNNKLLVFSPNVESSVTTTFDVYADDGSTQLTTPTTFDGNTTKFLDNVYNTGNVFSFNKISNKYIFETKISITDLVGGDNFGQGLDSYQNYVMIGSPNQTVTKLNGSSYTDAGYVYLMSKKSSGTSVWETLSSQPDLVDVNKLQKTFIYDTASGELVERLELIDPAKGKLFGPVEQNISYKTLYDPADYDSWGKEHVGEVWLDLNRMKFVWYEQDDLNFRLLNWGKLHPSSQVFAKEWTQSEYTPQEYNDLSITNEGQSQGITGTADPTFVTKPIFDQATNKFVTRYFFWVANPTVLPNNPYRTVTCGQIKSSLEDIKSYTNQYMAIVREDALLLSLTSSMIGNTTNLKIEQTTDSDALTKHTEYALVAEDDPNAILPQSVLQKFIDSLVGFDAQGRSVPDLGVPYLMRYGIESRPRQSVFKSRSEALQTVVEFVNQTLKARPYASTKTLTEWNKSDPIPSKTLEGYVTSVDTDTDLQYINTEAYSTGDKVLVLSDSNAENRWTLYTFTAEREFALSRVQSFVTNDFWSYADYYASGFDSDLLLNEIVDTEEDMRTGSWSNNTLIKVRSSYDGKERIYKKVFDGFEIIKIQDGTIQTSSSLYDFEANDIGYGGDPYSFGLYDKEATTELTNLINGLQNDIFIDEDKIYFNRLFFLMSRISQQQLKDVAWTFKTSFIKLLSTYESFEQPPEFAFNVTDAVEDFLQEVLPFKTKIRENVTQYKDMIKFEGDVTDFDNMSYYDSEQQKFVAPRVFPDDSAYFDVYNRNPHKFYSDNYKYSISSIEIGTAGQGYTVAPEIIISGGGGSGAEATASINDGGVTRIVVTNPGSGYYYTPTVTINGGGGQVTQTAVAAARLTNTKIRSFDTTIKFDRINSNAEIVNSVILNWEPFTLFTQNQNIRYENKIYRVIESFTSGATFTQNSTLTDSSSVPTSPLLVEWTATDRINSYYRPTSGMTGLIGDGSTAINAYAQLMTGLEYGGNRLLSLKFEEGEGFAVENYDMARYDTSQIDIVNPEQLVNLDQIVDSKTFTTTLGTKAEDINIVGDAFISEYSANAPEEKLPGGVYDTLDMKIYTQPSDGAGLINKKTYYGNGSQTEFLIESQINNTHSVRVFKNNQYQIDGTDYTLDISAKKITFTVAPNDFDIISITTFDISPDNLLGEFEFDGDGSTTTYNLPLSRDLAQQSYVLVNGVKTPVSISAGGDSASTNVVFSVAPSSGSKIIIYLFNKDAATKAYSEMTSTEYSVSTKNPTITLTTYPGVVGPYHHKILVEGVAGSTSTNRYRLTPPQISYYSGDGSTVTFSVPNNLGLAYLAESHNVEVWVNGIIKTIITDYTIFSDSSSAASVEFVSAPATGSTIAVVLKEGHDYEVSEVGTTVSLVNNWSTLTGNDSSTINNEKIFVTTFTNHDQMSMRTENFTANTDNVGDLELVLSAAPINSNYVFLAFNKEYLTSNHEFRVEGNKVIIAEAIANTGFNNSITVTYINGSLSQPAIGYRIFKDILNRYHYRRLSKAHTTTLAENLTLDSNTIQVADASVLPQPSISTNTPGVVFIGKERITYFTKSGNTLGQIMRGTLGTAITDIHTSGTKVIDASLVQEIPYSDTLQEGEFVGNGTTKEFAMGTALDSTPITASSKNQLVVQVGGTRTTDFTVNGSNMITFDTAPASGVLVRITKKLGSVWYDQGTSTAANGLGLQSATGVEVQFLQDSPAELPEN